MKSELKAKFLQHIIGKKKENEGFTLIELLVVIIIIGILSAIALPSFLNQANKGKQSEAKQYTGSMNRAQQAYYLENAEFTGTLNQLGLGIASETENYKYDLNLQGTSRVANFGMSKKSALKSYHGTVIVSIQDSTSEATTLAVLCESNNVGILTATLAPVADGTPAQPTCSAGFSVLKSK